MNINIHIMNANGKLTELEPTIKEVAEKAIVATTQKIPIDNVDIIFADSALRTIRDLGFGGYTYTKNLIMIPLDVEHIGLKESIEKSMIDTISHELYHCLCNYTFNTQSTLLEAVVNEGLAEHFSMEVSGHDPSRWATALDEAALRTMLEKAKKEFEDLYFDHNAWFFGTTPEIPYWAGYSLGFDIIKKYLEKHPNKKPSNLYSVRAEEFIS